MRTVALKHSQRNQFLCLLFCTVFIGRMHARSADSIEYKRADLRGFGVQHNLNLLGWFFPSGFTFLAL